MNVGEIVRIARSAGEAILDIYKRDFDIEFKADDSPLTEADKAAHKLIMSELSETVPDIPVLSEEDTELFNGANPEGLYWLVDPLDGTKEFVKRNGEFTVNIALIEHGIPILGVVYAPVLDEMYFASKGKGAFKVYGTGRPQRITVSRHEVGEILKVVGSRSHAGEETQQWLSQFDKYEMISMGSSLKLCLVAEGAAHFYPRLGPTSLWDTAAAHAVVLEAGGDVVDLNDVRLSYANTDKLLNPYFVVKAV